MRLLITPDDSLTCDHSNEGFFTEQYFPVVPFFITLYMVVQTSGFADEILNWGNQMLFGPNFLSLDKNIP